MTSHGAGNQTTPTSAPREPPGWLPDWLDWFWRIGETVVETLEGSFTAEGFQNTLVFFFILAVAYLLGKAAVWTLRRSVLTPRRMDPAIARLTGHFVVFLFVVLGFSLGLTLFGTSIAAFATGLGLLSLALGFGMQNSVANIVGGVSLAIDKPFRIGDRIQVGEYWGTVLNIGLRSTRIETPRKENVIIPNKIMEEREIWNYTLGTPQYRLDIDVGISYDSDWRLAERILLENSDNHPNILHFPPPRVVMRKFGDFQVELQLRCWIADVQLRADTISDILKSTKDRFDREGVEIPFPYRTLVYKKDLHPPAQPQLEEFKPFKREVEGLKILVAVAGPQPVRERASFVASIGKALGAGIVGLYIQRGGADLAQGEQALRILANTLRDQRIWFKPVVRSGDIVATIRDVAREEDADLILVGAGRGGVSSLWRRQPEIGSRLRQELNRPVFTVPKDLKLTPQLVSWLREQMQRSRDTRRGDVVDDEAEEDELPPASERDPTGKHVPGRPPEPEKASEDDVDKA